MTQRSVSGSSGGPKSTRMTFAPPSAGGRPRPTVAASAGRRPRAPPSEWRARGGWRAATTASPVAATGAAGGKASRTLSTAALAVDASSAVVAARGFGPSPAPPVAAHLSAGTCDGWGVTPSPSGSLPPGRCERPPRQPSPIRADVGAAPTVCRHCRCSAAFRRSRPRRHRAQPHPTSRCTTTPLKMGGGPPSHAAQEGKSDSFRLPTEISPQAGEETNGGRRGGAERCPPQREAAPYGVGGYADSMPSPLRGLLFAICSYGYGGSRSHSSKLVVEFHPPRPVGTSAPVCSRRAHMFCRLFNAPVTTLLPRLPYSHAACRFRQPTP